MLIDHLPRTSIVGRALRSPLRAIPAARPRSIISGAAAGLRWIPASGPHTIWIGLYERRGLALLDRAITPGSVFWDVGAHAGLYSLVAARRGAQVTAFEPLSENVRWIERHITLNRVGDRVTVHQCALSARSGVSEFATDASGMQGHLEPGARHTVDVQAADELDVPAPTIMKVDVEGAELDVLRGAEGTIHASRPLILLELHHPVRIGDCLAMLRGYEAFAFDARRYVCRPGAAAVRARTATSRAPTNAAPD